MPGLITTTQQPSSTRILKLGIEANRLRLVRLGAIADELQRAVWTGEALQLIRRFFPEAELPDNDWSGNFRYFLNLIEQEKWFVIDWSTLDYLYDWWNNVDHDDDEEPGIPSPEYLMADFLYGPPVCFYGFSPDQWQEVVEYDYPLLYTVAQFVREDVDLNVDTLLGYEIYDNDLGELDIDANIADAASLPEPLCWLPLLASYVREDTGNPLLDGYIDLTEWEGDLNFSWDDLEQVKKLSAEAAEAWAKIEKLCDFAGDDMLPVMEVLLYGNTDSDTDTD